MDRLGAIVLVMLCALSCTVSGFSSEWVELRRETTDAISDRFLGCKDYKMFGEQSSGFELHARVCEIVDHKKRVLATRALAVRCSGAAHPVNIISVGKEQLTIQDGKRWNTKPVAHFESDDLALARLAGSITVECGSSEFRLTATVKDEHNDDEFEFPGQDCRSWDYTLSRQGSVVLAVHDNGVSFGGLEGASGVRGLESRQSLLAIPLPPQKTLEVKTSGPALRG